MLSRHAIIIDDCWSHDEEDLSPIIAYVGEGFSLISIQSLEHGAYPRLTLSEDDIVQLLHLFGTEDEQDTEEDQP